MTSDRRSALLPKSLAAPSQASILRLLHLPHLSAPENSRALASLRLPAQVTRAAAGSSSSPVLYAETPRSSSPAQISAATATPLCPVCSSLGRHLKPTLKNGVLDIAPNLLSPRCSPGQQIHDTRSRSGAGLGARSPALHRNLGRSPRALKPHRNLLASPTSVAPPWSGSLSHVLLSRATAVAPDQPQGATFPR